jgi:Domain of unknown function (DUF5664)
VVTKLREPVLHTRQPEGRCACGQPWCDGCECCFTYCECVNLQGALLIGPEAPTVINAAGGKQSALPYSFLTSFPKRAIFQVAQVVHGGLKKYEVDNWRKIPRVDHLNHAIAHIFAYGAGDDSEGDRAEHLRHAACRILFALETT